MSSMFFTSFQEKVVFYFESLAKLCLYNDMVDHGDPSNEREERTMLLVNLSHAGKSCPRLFRVIKQKDGYVYQLLHEDGHYYMEEGFVTKEKLMSLLPKTEGGWKVELTWGPYQLL
ncbi:Hypothetical protein BQ3484_542 [Cedratvirus A11]|uniref:Uncharacterized protein n=1 Tax=Cedratvirus A11 TaxID=1903266 RepID=A0A1M7XVK8_9VIRU|nr:Hypothetical protein BQ3484_542 [Cedratvirus A11]SHO33610.1 Hypothetical protein BQ3484_542 [Cedratvirus A11]